MGPALRLNENFLKLRAMSGYTKTNWHKELLNLIDRLEWNGRNWFAFWESLTIDHLNGSRRKLFLRMEFGRTRNFVRTMKPLCIILDPDKELQRNDCQTKEENTFMLKKTYYDDAGRLTLAQITTWNTLVDRHLGEYHHSDGFYNRVTLGEC